MTEEWLWEAIREDINSHEEPEERHPIVVENDWLMDWED